MIDNEQTMRQNLDDRKVQLYAKLQMLEEQISETIEQTGSKVKSTAVAVDSAVHSVSNALDFRRQYKRRPWLWIVGALAAGYLAGGTRERRNNNLNRQVKSGLRGIATLDPFAPDDSAKVQDTSAGLSAVSAAYELGSRQSTANQARTLALNASVRIVEEIIYRSVPIAIGYFTRKPDAS